VTVSRPPNLAAGDEVRYRGATYTISVLSGTGAALLGATGARLTLSFAELFADPSFAVVTGGRRRAPLPPRGVLDGLPADVVENAEWWERHVVEVLTGRPPDAPATATPRPAYDPLRSTLRQREVAKVDELAVDGHSVPLSTLQRMRRSYQSQGLLGLVDGRIIRAGDTRVDQRVTAAITKAVAAETDRSTGTVTRLRRRVEQILATEHGVDPATVMPPRSTLYRLVERVAAGRHTFGSAPTRRSLAQRPDGPFGSVSALRPGEWMPIDSTPLDVRVVLDDGTIDRVELTMMVDVATRSIAAGVLRPTTKAVDASLLLARALTPEPMRPGWVDALRMSRSVLPHQRLVAVDERLEQAAARPVIVPETIVCDHGMVYLSQTFRTACRAMGINFQATHAGSPWEKGVVERSFASVATLFAQYVAGYVGRSVDRRGKHAERDAVWSMTELQDLLDEWIVALWQNRPHDGLRHPLTPGKALTPNEQYAALVEVAGYVPVPLQPDDYIELLPATWRVINSYGIKISHRTYDCKALNPYRRQHSGIAARKGQWEVHSDPYDVTRVWVRNHHDGGWITAVWTHLKTAPVPFGEQAWQQAQQILSRRGSDPATEAEIAGAVTALLDKAEHGPGGAAAKSTKRDRRVAARTRATATTSGWPRPADEPEPAPADDLEAVVSATQDGLAPVTPLRVFDAREEAKNWW
jgi:putative transposase